MLSNTLLPTTTTTKERSGSFKKMDTQKFAFLQSLVIKDCELWQSKDGHSTCRTRGNLQVLYSHKLDLFIMKLNDFEWALEKTLHVIGTFSEKEGWNTYILPNEHGLCHLKIISHDTPVIRNFETILSNTVNFSLRTNIEHGITSQLLHEEKHNAFTDGLKKTWQAISRPFTHHEDHPNQILLRNFEELKDLDSHSVIVFDIPVTEVQSLREEAGLHQETSHWRQFRETGQHITRPEMAMNNAPQQRIAGTGLTSQSMGEEHLNRKTLQAQDQQHVLGSENQRIPSYEADFPRGHIDAGLNKAFANLEGPSQTSLKKEDKSLTTGLMSQPLGQNQMNIEPLQQNKPIDTKLEKPRIEQSQPGVENTMKNYVQYDI